MEEEGLARARCEVQANAELRAAAKARRLLEDRILRSEVLQNMKTTKAQQRQMHRGGSAGVRKGGRILRSCELLANQASEWGGGGSSDCGGSGGGGGGRGEAEDEAEGGPESHEGAHLTVDAKERIRHEMNAKLRRARLADDQRKCRQNRKKKQERAWLARTSVNGTESKPKSDGLVDLFQEQPLVG
jgi:hypothetical protein